MDIRDEQFHARMDTRTGMPVGTSAALVALRGEVERQVRLWGEQNLADGTVAERAYWQKRADKQKRSNENAAVANSLTWLEITQEEVYEAFAEVEPDKLYVELIQAAACFVSWAATVRRRELGKGGE